MPHLIQKHYVNEMQLKWPDQFRATSSHRFRHPHDMQFSFSYMYHVMHRHTVYPMEIANLLRHPALPKAVAASCALLKHHCSDCNLETCLEANPHLAAILQSQVTYQLQEIEV
jgi:hypothetical protein